MNGHLEVIINQVIIFGMLMLIGYIASKRKVICQDSLSHLARFIVKIILPCLIFAVVVGSGVTLKDFLLSLHFTFAVIILFVLLPILGYVIAKLFRLEGKSFNIFLPLMTFGNMGFIGIPLINEVYKDPLAGVSITIYTLVDMSLLWTFGVYMCSRHIGGSSIKNSIKNMINPTTIALFLAILVLVFGIKLPRVIADTIYGIGGTSKYLTMIYIGAALSFMDHKGVLKKPHIFAIVIVKLIIMPVVLYGIFKNYLPSVQLGILSIVAGLPIMTTVVMLAKAYESDDHLATEAIFVTTISCLFTIPLVSVINTFLWR
ncbi:MAG: transporter [Calditerrivibrio nitroreducens]|uniref:Transporter n=1 Tax=Calditerrivibrio nitroreducens TaxID=477976 RepID=A0A2J6WI20_9BACT|nr:MAG: transporter [Calditerrivibrio nitroreducens]